jgi:hypothetical protein
VLLLLFSGVFGAKGKSACAAFRDSLCAKHGGWFNVFEVLISVLSVQCVGWCIFVLGEIV